MNRTKAWCTKCPKRQILFFQWSLTKASSRWVKYMHTITLGAFSSCCHKVGICYRVCHISKRPFLRHFFLLCHFRYTYHRSNRSSNGIVLWVGLSYLLYTATVLREPAAALLSSYARKIAGISNICAFEPTFEAQIQSKSKVYQQTFSVCILQLK